MSELNIRKYYKIQTPKLSKNNLNLKTTASDCLNHGRNKRTPNKVRDIPNLQLFFNNGQELLIMTV